jgi:hypothetical protein
MLFNLMVPTFLKSGMDARPARNEDLHWRFVALAGSSSKCVHGMISTHFSKLGVPPRSALARLDRLATVAAEHVLRELPAIQHR